MMPLLKLLWKPAGLAFEGTSMFWAGHVPYLCISDVKVVEELYTTQNIHYDKHPILKNLTLNLTGQSILFDESTENWKLKRKAMTPAFYKG